MRANDPTVTSTRHSTRTMRTGTLEAEGARRRRPEASARTACLAASLLAACGGAAPPTQAPALAKSSRVAVAAPPIDLSPLPEPSGLVVSGHFARPSASLAAIHAWSKRPMPQAEQITELLTGESLGPLVDLDQPVDFAVAALGSGARMRDLSAVSLAIKDAGTAKATLLEHHQLMPASNGALVIEGLGRSGHADDSSERGDDEDRRTCELAPAYGAAPLRLVCGKSAEALAQLGPWLTRTAVRAVSPSDAHVDVRMGGVHGALSAQKRLFTMVLASVMSERGGLSGARSIASGLAADLVDFALDLDATSLDLAATPGGDATMTAKLTLTGTESTFGRLANAHPERMAPPPAVFWQLPGEADVAFFGRGVDDADLARARDLVLQGLAEKLADVGVKEADRKPILDAVAKLPSSAPIAYAGGIDDDAAKQALTAERSLGATASMAERLEAKRATLEALLGWHLVEVDEPSAKLAGAMKELALAWSRPAIAAAYQAHAKGRDVRPMLRAAPATKASGAPPGASHYVVELPLADEADAGGAPSNDPTKANSKPKATGRSKPLAVHVLLAPDGARAWLALGGDEARLGAKLATAMGGPGATLASRADVGALKDARVSLGGFVTPRGFPGAAQLVELLSGPSVLGGQSPGGAPPLDRPGGDAVLFSWSAQPASPAGPAVTAGVAGVASVRLPRAALEEIMAAAMRFQF